MHADYAHPVFHFSPVNHVALESLLATHARAAVRERLARCRDG